VKNLELKQQLAFCDKYVITPNELLLLQIILLAQEGEDPELVKTYFNANVDARGFTRPMLERLQAVGIINKSYKIPNKGEQLDLYAITLNKNVIKDYYKCSFDMGKELFDAYPVSTVVNNIEYKLRRISKKFDSLEDAYRAYGKAISWNPETHNKVIELVKQGINNNYQFTTLGDFIVDRDWLNMEAMSTDGIMNNTSMKLL
jgi:hypothetical protein